jgi:uncharacterized protein
MKTLLIALLLMATPVFADYPEKLEKYFNDYANVVSPEKAAALNEQLANFEKETSNQFTVAVFPKLEGDLERTTIELARKWKVGQADKNNGVVFFVFLKDEAGKGKTRFEVGRGLEGALTDAKTKLILINDVKPLFKDKKWDEGFQLAVDKTIALSKNEYTTDPVNSAPDHNTVLLVLFGLVGIGAIIGIIAFLNRQKDKAVDNLYKSSYVPESKPYTAPPSSRTYIPVPIPMPVASSRGVARPRTVSTTPAPKRKSSSSSGYSSSDSSSSYSSGSSSSYDSGSSFSGGGGDFGGGGSSGDF